jgi:glycosyltransferase involved in cell wall biosynthesis
MRIGLVGYSCDTGLGEKNRQMERWLDIAHWLVKPNDHHPTKFPPKDTSCVCSLSVSNHDNFLESVDVVLFDETPYYRGLIDNAKRKGKRIVCVPAMEWFPFTGYKSVDLFICPTLQCYESLKNEVPSVYCPWPVDTERFKFQQRNTVSQFLFLNGNGGWRNRKGSNTIKEAISLWPEMPLTIISQSEESWPDNATVLEPFQSNEDIYSIGDVLINPCSIDGTGLQPREAMSCGMPVISTYGDPWNELPAIHRIKSTISQVKIKRVRNWYTPDAKDLILACKKLLGTNITEESREVRKWAERRSFSNSSTFLNNLIRFGIPGETL